MLHRYVISNSQSVSKCKKIKLVEAMLSIADALSQLSTTEREEWPVNLWYARLAVVEELEPLLSQEVHEGTRRMQNDHAFNLVRRYVLDHKRTPSVKKHSRHYQL